MAFLAYDELEELAGLGVKFVSLLLLGQKGEFCEIFLGISILVTNQSNKQGAVALERGLEKVQA